MHKNPFETFGFLWRGMKSHNYPRHERPEHAYLPFSGNELLDVYSGANILECAQHLNVGVHTSFEHGDVLITDQGAGFLELFSGMEADHYLHGASVITDRILDTFYPPHIVDAIIHPHSQGNLKGNPHMHLVRNIMKVLDPEKSPPRAQQSYTTEDGTRVAMEGWLLGSGGASFVVALDTVASKQNGETWVAKQVAKVPNPGTLLGLRSKEAPLRIPPYTSQLLRLYALQQDGQYMEQMQRLGIGFPMQYCATGQILIEDRIEGSNPKPKNLQEQDVLVNRLHAFSKITFARIHHIANHHPIASIRELFSPDFNRLIEVYDMNRSARPGTDVRMPDRFANVVESPDKRRLSIVDPFGYGPIEPIPGYRDLQPPLASWRRPNGELNRSKFADALLCGHVFRK